MKQPLISIIIPIYKAEQYLEKCLNSILSQTYTNLELICVNDGSPDKSLDILERYSKKDKRIFIINNSNCGVSASRNIALKKAQGSYTVFIDADDWIDSETIEIAYKTISQAKADIVMWSYISEHDNYSSVKHIFYGDKVFEHKEVSMLLHRRLFGLIKKELKHPELADSLCPVWGKLYRSEIIKGIQFVDLKEIGTYEDGLFNIDAFTKITKAVYIDKPLYHYRRNNKNAQTAVHRASLFDQWQQLYEMMLANINENNLANVYVEALYNKVALSILGLGMDIEGSGNTSRWKSKRIKTILSNQWYDTALKKLKIIYFPFHWQVFYFFAKHRCVFLLRLMIRFIRKVIS